MSTKPLAFFDKFCQRGYNPAVDCGHFLIIKYGYEAQNEQKQERHRSSRCTAFMAELLPMLLELHQNNFRSHLPDIPKRNTDSGSITKETAQRKS